MRRRSAAWVAIAVTTSAAVVASGIPKVAVAAPSSAPQSPISGVIAVGSAADTGSDTLRAAIEAANARPGADTITVAAGEPITVSSPLPAITDAVTIDTAHAELRGAGGGAGFTVLADDVSIAGFTISGFETGLVIDRSSRVTISRNAIADSSGSGVAIVGPTKEEVAAALSGGTITLEGLTALVPTDVEVRGNTFARNGGPAVTRDLEGVIAIDALTRDAATVRGAVRDAAESPSVEIYASGACDGARPQAETLLGTAAVAADGTFELTVPADAGEVTALPSDGLSGTGAISGCAQPAPAAPAPTTTTTAPPPTTTAPAPAPTAAAPEGELDTSGFVAAPAAEECTVKWNGLAGTSSWHDALNWGTAEVPGPTDVVCIPDGVYVLYTTGSSSVARLQVDGSLTLVGGELSVAGDSWAYELVMAGGTLTAAAEVSVTHTFNWTGGTLTGTGTLRVGAGASGLITDSGAKTLAGHLRNDGNLEWVDGTINLSNTLGKSHLDNYGTLTVSGDDTTDWTAGSCCPVITNRPGASVVKTGAGTATLGTDKIDLVNDGTVRVQAGTLWLDVTLAGFGGADITRGTWVVDDDATLKLWAANFVVNSTTIALGGPNAKIVDHTDADAFRNFATNSGTLTLQGRSLNLPGNLDNTGTLALDPTSVVKLAGDFSNWGGSRLEYEISGTVAGSGFGLVNPASSAYLGGTIAATLIGGFVPDPTDEFIVLDSSNLSGTFDAVEGDLFVTYDYTADNVVLRASDPYPDCDAVFIGGSGGSWHQASNWDSGYVPSGDDRACIPSGLTALYYTGTSSVGSLDGEGTLSMTGGSLTVMTGSSLGELDLGGGTITGDGDLTVTDHLFWTGGTVAGAGTLTVGASALAELAGGAWRYLGRHLRNDGTIWWSDGPLAMRTDMGGIAHLDNYGTFTIFGDDTTPWSGGIDPPLVTNRAGAEIVKTGSKTAYLGDEGTFVNEGTVTVAAGQLNVDCYSGCGGSGAWNVSGKLDFLGGEWDLTGQVSGTGTLVVEASPVRFSGAGRLGPIGGTSIDEGLLDVDSTPASPNTTGGLLVDGDLTGDGDLTVTEMFNWQSGDLTGTGTLTVGADVTGYISSPSTKTLGRHLRNDGGITWSEGTMRMRTDEGESHLENYGILNLSGTVSTDWYAGATPPAITNRPGGLLRKSGSWTTTATIGDGVAFSNEGAVKVEQGATLFLDTTVAQVSGTTLTGGKWEVVEGTLMVRDLSVVTNQGEIVMWGCCNLIVDQSWNDAVENVIAANQGTLSAHHKDFDAAGSFTNSGTIRLGPGSNIDVQDEFVQTSTGRLEVEVSGVSPGGSNGTIETNSATLAGTIESILVPAMGEEDPYEPGPTDEFTVIWADALTGAFSSVEGPLDVAYESNNVVLSLGGSGGCTVNWDGGAATTSWHDAANWSPDGVPGAGDVVCIPAGVTVVHSSGGATTVSAIAGDGALDLVFGSLSIADESQIGTLIVGGGGTFTGAGNMTVTNAFTWTAGELTGLGTLTVASGASGSLSGGAGKWLGRHVRNDGSLVWSDGPLYMRSDGDRDPHLDNYGTFTISGDDFTSRQQGAAVPRITNRSGASIVKTGAASATLGDSGTEFVNDGTVASVEGTLRVGGGAASGGPGTWNLSSGNVTFHTGTWELTGDVSGIGTVTVSWGGTVRMSGSGRYAVLGTVISGGTLDLDNTPVLDNVATDLAVSSGIFTGDGDLLVNEQLTWTGGELTGLGTLTVDCAEAPLCSFEGPGPKGLGRHVRNDGSLVWSDGPIYLRSDGDRDPHLDNYGTFTISGDDYTYKQQGTAAPRITNRSGASIVKTGAGTATLGDSETELVNDGTVTSVEGTLRVGGGAASGGPGTWDLLGGNVTFYTGTWGLTGDVSGIGTVTVPSGTTVRMSGSGRYAVLGTVISGGTLDLDNTPAIANVATDLTVSSGIFTGDGDVLVNEQFTWTGGELTGLGTLTVDCAEAPLCSIEGPGGMWLGRHVRNDGSLVWSDGTIYMRSDGDRDPHLDNYGTFTISGDDYTSRQQGTAVPRITNRSGASIVKTGAGTATLGDIGDSGTEFVNDGTVTSVEGTLRVGGGAASGGSGTWGLLGGNVTFYAGTWELTGDVSGIGTVTVSGGTVRMSGSARWGTVTDTVVSGGTLDLDDTPAIANLTNSLTVSSGVLTGDGDLLVDELFTWTGGELTGLGTLAVASGASGSLSGAGGKWLGRHVRNDGSSVWSDGPIYMRSDGDRDPHLDNYGTFTISGDDPTSRQQGTAVPRITNRSGASIVKTGAAGATFGDSGTEFVNDGTVWVTGGTLRLDGDLAGLSGTTLTGGTWNIDDGAILRVRNASIVTNAADIALLGPNADFQDHTGMPALSYLAVNDGELSLHDWNLALPNDLTNNGILTLQSTEVYVLGAFTQSAGGRLEVAVSGPVPNVDYGRVVAFGGATVDGTLFSDLIGGYTPGAGDTFTVIDAASLTGTFATVEGDLPVTYDVPNGDVVLGAGSIGDCTATWDGGASTTSWHDAANWAPDGVPGAGDVVCIPEGVLAEHSSGATAVAAIKGDGGVKLDGGSLETTDTSTDYSIGALDIFGGTFTADGNLAVNGLLVAGGILTGAGDVTAEGVLAWTGGELAGSGRLVLASGTSNWLDGSLTLGRHLVNNGSLHIGGDPGSPSSMVLRSDGDRFPHLDNYGTFELLGSDVDVTWSGGSTAPLITNRPGAEIVKDQAGEVTLGGGGLHFVNDGAITSLEGTLGVVGGTLETGGTGTWSMLGGDIRFGGGWWELRGDVSGIGTVEVSAGFVRMAGGARFGTVDGVVLSGGALDLDNVPAQPNTVDGLLVSGGELRGDGDLTVSGVLAWTGGELAGSGKLVLAPDTSNWLDGSLNLGRHLVNHGSLHIGGDPESPSSIAMSSDGDRNPHLDNYGTFELIGSDVEVAWTEGWATPVITNRLGAEIVKVSAGTITLGNVSTLLVNEGTVTVEEGTLNLDGVVAGLPETLLTGGGWIVEDGATLKVRDADIVTNAADIALLGPGAAFVDDDGANALRNLAANYGTLSLAGVDLAPAGDLTNGGTLKLDGSDVTLPGDFTQAADGRLEIPISGPVPGIDYGRIIAAGGAALDGTLAIITVDPYSPTDGVFTIIDAASVSGDFAAVEGADVGNGSSYQVRMDVPNGDVVLAVGETAHLAFTGDVAISETATDLDVGFELDRPLGVPVQVHFETEAGSATPGDDYTAVSGTAVVPAGETTGNVVVPLLEDDLYEGAESFTVRITGADAGTDTIVLDDAEALVTILDDEEPILPAIQILPQSAGEAAGSFVVEVKGSGGNTPWTFPFQVFAGTAVAPDDYSQLLTPATVTVPADGSVFVAVPLVSDLIDEDDEVFTVDVGGTVGTMTIVDDDLPPVAVIDGQTITEGDGGTIDVNLVVRLVDPFLKLLPQESGRIVTVAADTLDGTALADDDYVATSGVVTFSPGQTTRTFTVPIVGDEVDEDTETFTVDLDALTNVTVDDDEGATVTIVDDDGSGNADEIAQQLETGSASLFDVLGEWGAAFDLDGFDGSDPEMFELPGLTDDLARLFEPQDDLGSIENPFEGLSDDLEALCDQLEALGVTIDWVEGAACGRPAPPTGPDVFQVRYEATLADLAQALGFSGDELNDDMQGALEGLASALDLDADFTPLADLVVTLVVGVDEAGFYVSGESGLRLDIGATGTVSGGGAVAGADGLTIEGTASVDISVSLTADRGPARLRVAHLAGSPLAYLRPSATGTVELGLGAVLGPAALDWTGSYTLTVDEDLQTSTELDSVLEATLTLPGVTEDGAPAVFTLLGTYDGEAETWTLTGGGDEGSDYALHGFDIEELGLEVVLTLDSFGGSASFALKVDFGGPETPLTLDCDAIFDETALHAECHLAFDEATLGASPALVYLGGVTVGGVFDGDVATGSMTGGIDVAVDTLVLLPQPAPPGAEPEGAARAEDVTGSFDSNGNLALHAGFLAGSIGGEIDFEIEGVDLSLGPDATGPVFSVASVVATIPSLDGLGVTLTGFHLNRDGTFGAESVGVVSQGFLQTIGLGGILPFDVTEVSVRFPDWEDLDTFEVEVTGHFDFAPLAALPFTPVLGLGGDPVTPSSPPEDNVFTFTIAVDSLSEGEVRPWDLGPITLGFDDLEVGEYVTLGAQLTLGSYQDGEWVDDFGGSLSIESGLDGIVGDATIDVTGSLDATSGAAALDLTGSFAVSANLSEDIRIEGASLDFALGVAVDDTWQFTITGPTLTGAGIDRIEIAFGDFMRLVGTGVDIDFAPAPGDPLVAFGGQPCEPGEEPPCDGSLAVEFEEEFEVLSGWGGEAGNFAIDADLTPMLLPGFFLDIDVPDGEHFGLPEWLPVRVDEVGIRFPDVDFENIPPEGLPISDLGAFAIRFSGGIEANETWPITAEVDGLEVDLGKLANLEFPITNLDGFRMGVEPFELVPGFEIGGGLELKTIAVDGDPAPGEQIEDVFYGRIYGQFEYEGFGAGVDLVVTQYGPVLAKVLVPLGIPIDGGLLGGVILSGVEGGLAFGGAAFPDPQSPLEILHDPAFDTDFPVNDDTIRASVEPAVQTGGYTWDSGFTLALSGNLTHAMAPAIVSGDVTIGMNVGLIPGRQGVKFIGSGDISAWGMEFAGAALLIDLTQVLEPTFDFAFETPQPGNPLSFLLPAQATFEASLDTKGVLPGFALGVATFVERAVSGSLEVGQDFFDATLDALATSLEGDHTRPLARLMLDTNGDGLVSGAEDQQAVTRAFLTARALALMGGGGLPSDPAAAGRAARMFVSDLLTAGSDLAGGFDLSDVFTHADYTAFADLLGAGGEAVAALLGVVRDAVMEAGQAFWSEFDPSFHLKGMLQPIILGIPFGEPQHQVELIISKTGLGFGFDTSIGDIGMQLCDRIIPFVSGAACTAMTLGFEDHLGMTFELPIGGVVEGLFDGSGLPTLDPWSGDWAIELRGGLRWLDFEVGQMTGLIVAAGNPAFLDAHVQKLWEDPGASIDPSRIPIRTEQHYDDIVEHGGVLLTGRLLLPELLTDPVALLSSLNLEVPDDIADMPDWVAAIADHLGRIDEPAAVQLFMPGFGSVLEADFDAPTEAQRLTPVGSGQALADAFNEISEAAYIEGVFDGTLLSLPFGRAVVTANGQKLSVEGELPLIGLDTRIDLDVNPTLGTDGMVDLPRAAATVTVDAADIDEVLAGFGIPPVVRHIGTSTSSFRAISPGYDPSSSDPLLRRGGIELAGHLAIEGLVDDADFRLVVAPPAGAGLPDLEGHASVDQIGPLGGVTIHDVAVDLVQRAGDFSIGLDGTAEILGASARVHGELNPDLTGELAVEFDSGGPSLMGFDISGGWVLSLTRPGGVLTATFAFDGEVVFPSWLSGPGGQGRAQATGSISTDGTIDLALDLSEISLFGFTMRNGTFGLSGDERRSSLVVDAELSFLGAVLDVGGSLTIGASGPAGTLALAFASGSSLAFGPVTVQGAFSLKVGLTSASVTAAGTANIPGVANGVGISGSIGSNGTGSLALTGSSLGVKGFSLSRLTSGSPIPPLASIIRTLAATTMTVDARFSFLGSNLDVDGNLTLAAGGPTGSLALTYNGSGNIPFSGWTLEGGVAIAVTPTAGSIAINSKLDIPGLVSNATVTGSLNSSLLGSLSVSVGTIAFGAFSLTGTFTLSRSGSPAVVTLGALNVNLAWGGVSTFTVNTFSIGTDGHFDASVQGKTLSISAFSLTLPSFNLHVGAGATGVKLQIGQSSLGVSGIGALTIPAFDVDTTGNFSRTLVSTHLDLSALDLDGKLIFERQSGVFRLRVTGTTASNKATVSIPGLATVTVDNFTIASDSTFDVAATSTRLGPDALSIRGASIRVKKTGTSLSTIKVSVTGGRLYMPVGDPITLPSLTIDGDATWSHTFTATGINLGPALRTTNDPSFTLSLSSGVLRLSLNSALGVTVLAGSVNMELRTFAAASDGTFEGTVRGRLAMLGFTLASATFDVTRSGSAVRLRIPSSSPVSVDLGAVSASVYGSVYSDGRFDFSGSTAVDLTLLTVGLKGSATARLRNSGLSGTFTGKACALGVCVDLLSASIGNDGKLRVVIAGTTFYLPLFGAATVPADTLAPLLSQVSDITVTANVATGGTISVSYTRPTATDNVDPTPTVTCTPSSGSQFAVGSTTVTCTARDDAGNTSSRTFKITVVDDDSLASGFTSVIGGDILLGGGGFSGGSLITGTLFSDPIPLGTTRADADGQMSWTVEIPRSARPGRHHIVCEGVDPSGDPHMLVFPVLIRGRVPQGPPTSLPPVTAAGATTTTSAAGGPGSTGLTGSLPFTGGGAESTVPRALVLLLAGVLFVIAARRSRHHADLRR